MFEEEYESGSDHKELKSEGLNKKENVYIIESEDSEEMNKSEN